MQGVQFRQTQKTEKGSVCCRADVLWPAANPSKLLLPRCAGRNQEREMSRDIIERRQIDFVSADERFSRSPRELTPTGQPAKPPDEQILYGVIGNRLNPPTFETGVPLRRRTAVEGIAPTHDRPGKRNAAGAGRRSEIDMKICIDGKPHEWHSKGPLEVRCARCPRIALKSKIGTEKIHAMKYKAPI